MREVLGFGAGWASEQVESFGRLAAGYVVG